MADEDLPIASVSAAPTASEEATAVAERRAFLRRAALVGLPVLLASVRARTAWGEELHNLSCAASLGASGCAERNGL